MLSKEIIGCESWRSESGVADDWGFLESDAAPLRVLVTVVCKNRGACGTSVATHPKMQRHIPENLNLQT
jgi:hypothetical protein